MVCWFHCLLRVVERSRCCLLVVGAVCRLLLAVVYRALLPFVVPCLLFVCVCCCVLLVGDCSFWCCNGCVMLWFVGDVARRQVFVVAFVWSCLLVRCLRFGAWCVILGVCCWSVLLHVVGWCLHCCGWWCCSRLSS